MARYHECDVISFGAQSDVEQAAAWISSLPGLNVLGVYSLQTGMQWAIRLIKHILKGAPPSFARWDSKVLIDAIQAAIQQRAYDVVHIDMINMALYHPLVRDLPTVLSVNDAVSMRYWRMAGATKRLARKALYAFSAWRIGCFERNVYPQFCKVHLVSSLDAKWLICRVPQLQNVVVIKLPVDDLFFNVPILSSKYHPIIFTAGDFRFEYIERPVLEFVTTGFKIIRKIQPDVRFIVIGRHASRKAVQLLLGQPGIQFMPWVEDYVGVLASASIALFLDAAGSGVKNRVLQALAAGKPVVGTPVAFEGLDVTNGVNGFVCHSLNEVVETVIKLLQNREMCARVGRAARELVKRYHNKVIIGRQWEALYQQAIAEYHKSKMLSRSGSIGRA